MKKPGLLGKREARLEFRFQPDPAGKNPLPQMDTDKHGLRQNKMSLQQTGTPQLVGNPVYLAQNLSPSVSICVHPWFNCLVYKSDGKL